MINEELQQAHYEDITDEKARRMYEYLCDACDRREEGLTDPDQALIFDIAMDEQIKGMLRKDIAERGIGREMRNGRQTYWQDNKSLAHLRAYSDQQRKHLSELKLTPARRKAEQVEINDDFDDFR